MNWGFQLCLKAYLAAFPNETGTLSHLLTISDDSIQLSSRKNFDGHVTASALAVDFGRSACLLVFHKQLNTWLQPGGHLELNESPWSAAVREANEETGIGLGELASWHMENGHSPIDIDIHTVPANTAKQEPEHRHMDFRYLFEVDSRTVINKDDHEIIDVKWFQLDRCGEFLGERIIAKINLCRGLVTTPAARDAKWKEI